ncbi:MAG: VOC family protein [Lewinellaceae bacterium]|nr:VOC family protein [Lewinellaceae bacterium]
MNTNLFDVLENPRPFLEVMLARLQGDHITVQGLTIDHLCYRVATQERYWALRQQLGAWGNLLAETPVAGRPIATFQLHQPIVFEGFEIPCLELPAPKSGSPYAEGFEHFEMVVDKPLEEWLMQYPTIPFDLSDFNKPLNRDVRIRYPEGSVKFHENSLHYVITVLER